MSDINNETCYINLRDKKVLALDYFKNFINRLDNMFVYSGLPETIPDYILNRYLFINGWCGIGMAPEDCEEYKGKLVCFFGGLGGTPDLYYRPTNIILANPILGSKTYTIDKDVVLARNDSLIAGITPLLSRYSNLLAENDISINIAQVTTRIPFIISAETDNELVSANEFIKQAEDGRIGIVKSSYLNKGVVPQPTISDSSGGYIKALIELHHYIKAQCNNDFGIGSNFNMKRERLSTAEVENDSPYLLPFVDEMFKFRKIMCDEVNKMFGTKWSVDLGSAWKIENSKQNSEV